MSSWSEQKAWVYELNKPWKTELSKKKREQLSWPQSMGLWAVGKSSGPGTKDLLLTSVCLDGGVGPFSSAYGDIVAEIKC